MDLLTDSRKPEALTVRLTPEMDRKLDEFKQRTGISRGRLVRAGIELALEKFGHLAGSMEATR